MKKIKLIIIILILFISTTYTRVFAESYSLDSNYSSNGEHYYFPKDISLPISDLLEVTTKENIKENYLIDFDDISWNLYSVSLEFSGDGTPEYFNDLQTIILNSPIDPFYFNSFTLTNNNSYIIDGKSYTPKVDNLILSIGNEIHVKNMGDDVYDEGESTARNIFIQYSLNRYNSSSELNECINTNDSNEKNMRKGLVQVLILFPSTESIDTYYKDDDVKNSKIDLIDEFLRYYSNDYLNEVSPDGNVLIKDFDNNNILELNKLSKNKVKILLQDVNLDIEDVNEILIDIAKNVTGSEIQLNVNLNDYEEYIISTGSGEEIFKITEQKQDIIIVELNDLDDTSLDNEDPSFLDASNISDVKLSLVPIVEAALLIVAIVVLVTIIVKTSFKKKK